MSTSSTHPNELLLTRVFNAPRKLVWEVWTTAEHMPNWLPPHGFSLRVEQNDFRPGGKWRYIMIGNGVEFPCEGVFQEIVPYERYVSTDGFPEDVEGVDRSKLPDTMVVTTIFEDIGEKTRVTIRVMHPTPEDKRRHEEMGVVAGWESTFSNLDRYLVTLA